MSSWSESGLQRPTAPSANADGIHVDFGLSPPHSPEGPHIRFAGDDNCGMQNNWPSVWAALSDESLEHRLRHYYWLTRTAPNIYMTRYAQLVAEAKRREKLEIVENAKQWVVNHDMLPPRT